MDMIPTPARDVTPGTMIMVRDIPRRVTSAATPRNLSNLVYVTPGDGVSGTLVVDPASLVDVIPTPPRDVVDAATDLARETGAARYLTPGPVGWVSSTIRPAAPYWFVPRDRGRRVRVVTR